MAGFPQSVAWGHAGTVNAAQFALMNPATYTGQQVAVDDGAGVLTQRTSNGVAWLVEGITAAQAAAVLAAYSTPNATAGDRAFVAGDDGKPQAPPGALTLTVPIGLGWTQGVVVELPSSGTVSFAVTGGATINGGTSTLTRTRASNPVGVCLVPYFGAANTFGLSGV